MRSSQKELMGAKEAKNFEKTKPILYTSPMQSKAIDVVIKRYGSIMRAFYLSRARIQSQE